jgi:hypothetical protein
MDMDMDIIDDQQLVFQKGNGTSKENCGNDQYFDQILDHPFSATYKQVLNGKFMKFCDGNICRSFGNTSQGLNLTINGKMPPIISFSAFPSEHGIL